MRPHAAGARPPRHQAGQHPGGRRRPRASREHVYLTDFGLTKGRGESKLTQTGTWVGTVSYIAPEQVEGRAVDGRADLYSLACVVYEALTGAPAVRARLGHRHAVRPPAGRAAPAERRSAPACRRRSTRWWRRGWPATPNDRYQSGSELGRALRDALLAPVASTQVGQPIPTFPPQTAPTQPHEQVPPVDPSVAAAAPPVSLPPTEIPAPALTQAASTPPPAYTPPPPSYRPPDAPEGPGHGGGGRPPWLIPVAAVAAVLLVLAGLWAGGVFGGGGGVAATTTDTPPTTTTVDSSTLTTDTSVTTGQPTRPTRRPTSPTRR